MQQTILEVKNLTTSFKTERGVMKAIDGINFRVNANEILGIVGESGCGKSVTCQSIMRLYDEKYTVILRGEILFKGENLLKYSGRKMQSIRGDEISMVFQDALSALNPVMRVGDQIMEAIKLHNKGISKQEARERALNILKLVGIPAYKERFSQYPHELSGGMRQRVMIAIALVCKPSVLITHDLAVVSETCDRVIVMYLGQIVEEADAREIFSNPKHPYTKGLMQSIPQMTEQKPERLYAIRGTVPLLNQIGQGCRFADRCEYACEQCRKEMPQLQELENGHTVRCFLAQGVET